MVGRRIGYLLLLAVGIYFGMLYDFQGLRYLICCVVCLPLASLLLLVPKAFLCRVSVGVNQNYVTRGEAVNVRMTVENQGLFPVTRMRLMIRWKAPGEKEITFKKWLYGFGRGCEEVELELSAPHCGQAQIAITKAGICDYLGIFILPVKCAKPEKFCITPVITPIVQDEMMFSAYYISTMNGEREGEGDVTLREYQPGDSLYRVYWKLAAKVEELQVRELERSESVILYLNYSDAFREQAEKWDRYLDIACSLIYFLAEENKSFRMKPEVVWRQENAYWKYEIDGMEALQGWILALLRQGEAGMPADEGYRQQEGYYLREGFHLEEDCKLYLGEQCVYE